MMHEHQPGHLAEVAKVFISGAVIIVWIVVVLCCVFNLFAEEMTALRTMGWLPWVILPSVYVPIALLIMSIWRPARLFTGTLMALFAVLSFSALISFCGIAMRLFAGRILPAPMGIGTCGIGWLFLMIIGIFFHQDWSLLIYILIWMGTDMLAAGLGVLIAASGYGWLEDQDIKWLKAIIKA